MFELGDDIGALDARYEAQKIAFGPVVFQVARCLRDSGLLSSLDQAGEAGLTAAEAVAKTGLSPYAAKLLLEGGLSARIVGLTDARWTITAIGRFLLKDRLTRVNMDFTHDVCYQGLFDLAQSLDVGRPVGLRTFGDQWPTIYEALQHLPAQAKASWLAFDHFYSDSVYPELLPFVFKARPKTLLDVGGNTGAWAIQCVRHDPAVEVTILDLPATLGQALAQAARSGFGARIRGVAVDVLNREAPFPQGFDAVWMSQFLCCFAEDEIVGILRRAARALSPDGRIYVNETFWDRQEHEIAAYCIINTSPYFAALANGNSKMYGEADMLRLFAAAELEVVDELGPIIYGHSIVALRPTRSAGR